MTGSSLPAPTTAAVPRGLDSVPCYVCGGPVRLVPSGWQPGDPCYCPDHTVLEGRDPRVVMPQAIQAAVADLNESSDVLVGWCLPSLTEAFGYLLPGTVNYACAFPKNGKTAFLSNNLAHWDREGVRVWVMPTESRPKGLVTRLAAFRVGISADEVMSRRLRVRADQGDPIAEHQLQQMYDAFQVMMDRDRDDGSNICIEPAPRLTRSVFRESFKAAVAAGCQLVVVDHVDHIGADPNSTLSGYAASEAVQHDALEFAETYNLAVLLMSQLNASRVQNDKLYRYRRPIPDWLWMKGAKDQVVTTMVGIYRPMKPNLDEKVLAAVRNGDTESWHVAQPYTMGVVDMLSRYNGARPDRATLLRFEDGVLSDLPAADAFTLEAEAHGIWTGGASERPRHGGR